MKMFTSLITVNIMPSPQTHEEGKVETATKEWLIRKNKKLFEQNDLRPQEFDVGI